MRDYINNVTYITEDGTVRHDTASELDALKCPYCHEPIWDGPKGHKLAKCWNYHPETGGTLAFDTMAD